MKTVLDASPLLGEGSTIEINAASPIGAAMVEELERRRLELRKSPVARSQDRRGTDALRSAAHLMGSDTALSDGDVVPALDAVEQQDAAPQDGGGEGEGGNTNGLSADRLRSIVERIERLAEERKALGVDIKDILVEAKSAGFDVKVIRRLLQIRKIEPQERDEQEEILAVYMRALGM